MIHHGVNRELIFSAHSITFNKLRSCIEVVNVRGKHFAFDCVTHFFAPMWRPMFSTVNPTPTVRVNPLIGGNVIFAIPAKSGFSLRCRHGLVYLRIFFLIFRSTRWPTLRNFMLFSFYNRGNNSSTCKHGKVYKYSKNGAVVYGKSR